VLVPARILRITSLDNRLPIFTGIDQTSTGRYQEHSAGNPPSAAGITLTAAGTPSATASAPIAQAGELRIPAGECGALPGDSRVAGRRGPVGRLWGQSAHSGPAAPCAIAQELWATSAASLGSAAEFTGKGQR